MKIKISFLAYLLLPTVLFLSVPAKANNYLGYRWASTQSPFVLQLGSNVNNSWQPIVQKAAHDWSLSPMLNLVPGSWVNQSSRLQPYLRACRDL
jgi:hypothetical protein